MTCLLGCGSVLLDCFDSQITHACKGQAFYFVLSDIMAKEKDEEYRPCGKNAAQACPRKDRNRCP